MGQTLSHGVYLPNEGERNCYAGLASNWQILNTAVGNIAEKAPLVHTHGNITNDGKVGTTANVPLITGTGGAIQAGSFGNAANTFCEGNDSRLSDARTPVAHTHTKSDVTDLLNSNFIPSANNSYDLGSSSYQWNNLYAKNYYYNGTAWGLDKANTWTDSQIVSGSEKGLEIRNPDIEKGVAPSANKSIYSWYCDKNGTYLGRVCNRVSSDGATLLWLSALNYFKNGALDPTGSSVTTSLFLKVNSDATKEITVNSKLYPVSNNTYDLGTSTNKWKSLNGINPGALSLPGAYQSINDQIKDPNGQLNAFDLNGGSNTWVSDVDCYLYFYIPNNKFTWIRIFWPATLVRCGQTFVPVPNESSDYSGFVPVPANTTVVIQVKGTQAPIFRRSACLGNV